jgi:hypothetical protein
MPAIINPSKAFENILAASKASGGWTLDEDGTPVVVVLAGPYTGSWRFQTHPNRTIWVSDMQVVAPSYGGLRTYQLQKIVDAYEPLRRAIMATTVTLLWAPHVRIPFSSPLNTRNYRDFMPMFRKSEWEQWPDEAQIRRGLKRMRDQYPAVKVTKGRVTLPYESQWLESIYFFMNMAGISAQDLAAKLNEQPKRWSSFGRNQVLDNQYGVLMNIVEVARYLRDVALPASRLTYRQQLAWDHKNWTRDKVFVRDAVKVYHRYFPDLPVRETIDYLGRAYEAVEPGRKARGFHDIASVLYESYDFEDDYFVKLQGVFHSLAHRRGDSIEYPKGLKDRLCFARNFAETWSAKKALRMTCPNIEAAHKLKGFSSEDIPMMKWALNFIPSVRQKIPAGVESHEITALADFMKSRGMRAGDFRKVLSSKDGWRKLQQLHGGMLAIGDAEFAEYLADSVEGRRIIAARDRNDWQRLTREGRTLMDAYRSDIAIPVNGETFREFLQERRKREVGAVAEDRAEALEGFVYPPGVYPLICEDDYQAEGTKMRHCIYSYRDARQSLFFGFDCGSSNATLEVSLGGKVKQFYAEDNAPPSQACKRLLREFLAQNSERFAAFREAGRTRVNPRKRPSRRRKARQPRRRR